MDCLVLAALLCMNEPATVTSFQHGLAAGAWVNVGDVLITSVIDSDDVGYPDKALMEAHCVGDACLYTRVRCHTGSKLTCTLDYVTSEVDHRRHVSVVGRNKTEILAALSPIALEPMKGLRVGLTDLKFEDAMVAALAKHPLFQ